jgi:hypothetical protein
MAVTHRDDDDREEVDPICCSTATAIVLDQ